MATFEAQVEALTGITINSSGTNPTEGELTQFLIDGVLDVTEKWLIGHPQDREQFTRISGEVTSNGSEKVGRADIIAVVRESGTNNDWRPCRKISPIQQSEVLDTESLSFASKYHPVYMVAEDGAISVFPVPDTTTDAFKVYYVNYSPRADNDDSLTHASSGMLYFPQNKTYLVATYASMRSLQAKMAATTITDLTVTVVPPDAPLTPSFSAASVSAVTNRAISASAPAYDNTIASSEFGDLATLIDTDEDVELATAKLQEIQALIQNELNEFNQANIAYQQDIQEALGEMQVAAAAAQKKADFDQQTPIQEYANKLQKFQMEYAGYTAEVNEQVQAYTQNLQADGVGYQWLQDQYNRLKAEYDAAFMIAAPKSAPQPARR